MDMPSGYVSIRIVEVAPQAMTATAILVIRENQLEAGRKPALQFQLPP